MRKQKRRRNSGRIIWHYTVGDRFPAIMTSGVIRRATSGVMPPEKPVTWFSMNQAWEVTASKALFSTDRTSHVHRDVTHWLSGGLVRIGVELQHAPYGIDDLQRVARCDHNVVMGLKRSGMRVGANPYEWRFTLKEVPASLWKRIEIWDGEGLWVPFDGDPIVPPVVPVGSDMS